MSAVSRTFTHKRPGLIAEKIGMTFLYNADGARVPVTVFQLHETVVLGMKTTKTAGYESVMLATKSVKASRQSKPQSTMYKKLGLSEKKYIKEFRVSSDVSFEVGTQLYVEHFAEGQIVDVSAISIGKGFAGVMKRHNFRGLEASHGVSVSHRSHGSTGQRQDPGKVFKNKKMAGHLGDVRVTVQNLQVVKIDKERQLIFIKGATPGAKGTFAEIKDAVKRALHPAAPYPTFTQQKIAVLDEVITHVEPQIDNSGE